MPRCEPRSARTARDNARAQAAGYRDYYDYRIHGYGRIPPGVQVGAAERRQYRGHAGLNELLAAINRVHRYPDGTRGPLILEIQPQGTERGAGGRWRTIRFDAYLVTGQTWRFYLRGRAASHSNLLLVKAALANPGALRRRDGGTPPGGWPAGTRGEGVSYPLGGGGDGGEGEDDFDTSEEEWDADMEWDDYYFDEDEAYDWDIPYGQANSVGEFA